MAENEKKSEEADLKKKYFEDIDQNRIELMVELASKAQEQMDKSKPGAELEWLKEKMLDFRFEEIVMAFFITANAATGGEDHPARKCMRAIIGNINAKRIKKFLGEVVDDLRKMIKDGEGKVEGEGDGQ